MRSHGMLGYLTLVLLGQCLGNQDSCSIQSMTSPGDVMFGILTNIHVEGEKACSKLSPNSLVRMVAINWLFEKLNQNNYIKGVRLGTVTYDACGREDVADAMLTRLVPEHTTGTCQPRNISGIIAATWSGQTAQVGSNLRAVLLPVLAPTSTAASLSDRKLYPNVFRPVPTDTDQMKLLSLLAKDLGWLYVAVVYTDDKYGREGAQEFIRLAKQAEVCVGIKMAIPLNHKQQDHSKQRPFLVLQELLKTASTTKDHNLGVIYIGQKSVFADLMRTASTMKHSTRELQNLLWLVSDPIGLDQDVFGSSSSYLACNVMSITLSYPFIREFKEFWIDQLMMVIHNGSRPGGVTWYKEYVETLLQCSLGDVSEVPQGSQPCNVNDESTIRRVLHQEAYLYHTVAAAYTIAKAVKSLQMDYCQEGFVGVCEDMHKAISNGKLLAAVKYNRVQFYIDRVPQFDYLPKGMQDEKWHIQFDRETGALVPDEKQPAYYIHDFKCLKESSEPGFHKVGEYFTHGDHLELMTSNTTFVIPSSEGSSGESEVVETADSMDPIVCVQSCQTCGCNNASVRFVYKHGQFLLVGLVALHHKTENKHKYPFACGEMRMGGGIQLEAAFFTALDIFNDPSGPYKDHVLSGKLGGLILDTCYNSLRASNTVSRFHSGDLQLKSSLADGGVIDSSRVVGYIGALSSEVTQIVADILKPLNLMLVTFGSTAASLFSKPNVLRTVPADDMQAKAMIEVVRKLGWKAVHIVYLDNAYGRSGLEELTKYAKKARICIPKVEKVDVIPNSRTLLQGIVNRYRSDDPLQTRVVILFLPQFETIEFLQVAGDELGDNLFKKFIWIGTESWADRMNVLEETAKEALGSLTVKMKTHPINRFQKYFKGLSPWKGQGKSNPFLIEYWEKHFRCKLPNVYRPGDPNPELCTEERQDSLETDFSQDALADKVIFATLSSALGISSVAKRECTMEDLSGSCCPSLRKEENLMRIKKETKTVDLMGLLGHPYQPFTQRGDGNVNYIISNVQIGASGIDGPYVYKEVGKFDFHEGLEINSTALKFYDYDGSLKKIDTSGDCNLSEKEIQEDAWQKNIYIPGDVSFAALLPIHPEWHEDKPLPPVCPSSVLQVETLLWALNRINLDDRILPNIDLGAHILDTFGSPEIGFHQAVSLLGPGRYLQFNISDVDVGSLLGFLSGSQPDVAFDVRRVTSAHKRLQVEFSATLTEFDQHLDVNKYLLRTSHSVEVEVRAIVKVLDHFRWSDVSVVYTDCVWGNDAFKLLKKLLSDQETCISNTIRVKDKTDQEDALSVAYKLTADYEQETRVVIMLLKDYQTEAIVEAIGQRRIAAQVHHGKREGYTDQIFIGGEFFLAGLKRIRGLHIHAANRSIGIRPVVPDVKHAFPELIQHLKGLKDDPKRNPWFTKAAMAEALDQFDKGKDLSPMYVMNAVYTFAVGLHNMQRMLCGRYESVNICPNFVVQNDIGLQLTQYAREAYMSMREEYPNIALSNTPDMEVHFFTVDSKLLEPPILRKAGVVSKNGHLELSKTLPVTLSDVVSSCEKRPTESFVKSWKLPVVVASAVLLLLIGCFVIYRRRRISKKDHQKSSGSSAETTSLPGRPVMGTFVPSHGHDPDLINSFLATVGDASALEGQHQDGLEDGEMSHRPRSNSYQNDSVSIQSEQAFSQAVQSNVEFEN